MRINAAPTARVYRTVLALALASPCMTSTTHASAHRVSMRARGPAPVFRPILNRVHRSRVPVYLPSWLPRFPKRVYPFFSAANPGGMATYDVELSIDAQAPCNACDAFYVSGAQGDISISPYTHPVSLGKGKWAYHVLVHGSMGEEFRWYIGENGYAIRCNCTDAQYVRIVDSMVPAR